MNCFYSHYLCRNKGSKINCFSKTKLIIALSFSLLFSCKNHNINPQNSLYRSQMRQFVQELSKTAKTLNPNFLIIPQNGPELLTLNGETDGVLQTDYLKAIDGIGREDLFYGYRNNYKATPKKITQYMLKWCQRYQEHNLPVLVIDYCKAQDDINKAYLNANNYGFISFAAQHRNLTNIPTYPQKPYLENAQNIYTLKNAKNFLFLINSENFTNKEALIEALSQTNYDLLILDFFHEGTALTTNDVYRLRYKKNGGKRLVVCYLSIGEAEEYRNYWQSSWKHGNPDFINCENPKWKGNYLVKYWDNAWKNIINSYLKNIISAGFDGVYLDKIDAFEDWESR